MHFQYPLTRTPPTVGPGPPRQIWKMLLVLAPGLGQKEAGGENPGLFSFLRSVPPLSPCNPLAKVLCEVNLHFPQGQLWSQSSVVKAHFFFSLCGPGKNATE